MPPADQVSSHYQGDRGVNYVAQRQADAQHPGFEIDAGYFLPYISPSDRVLDFGCGNGGMLVHLAKRTATVEGLEVNPSARAMAEGLGFIVHTSLDQLPADTTYNIIVSNHVLEHVPNVCEVLERLRRYLAPSGLLVTKLPIDDIRARHQRSWSKDDVDHHLQTWTPRLFANVLYESGFDVREIRIITSAYHHKLFPLRKIGLDRLAYWALAVLKNRRQLFAVARNPS